MRTNKIILSCVFAFSALLTNAQIIVTQTQTPTELVNDVLVGTGVVISNVKFNNSVPLANAIQTQVGYFNANATSFPLDEGIVMGTGNVILAVGPNNSGSATNTTGVAPDPGDPDLAAIGAAVMNNEAVLEFDFVLDGDSVLFRYVFASEEYPEYSPSSFNDAFGFFISGPGFAGPYTGGGSNFIIEKYSFSVDGNSTDVGDLTARVRAAYPGGSSSATHGYCAGGNDGGPNTTNVIDRWSFATDGNATDVGDLTTGFGDCGGSSSTTHGYVFGGWNVPVGNIIEKYAYAASGNSTDVGDLTTTKLGWPTGNQF